ncbi:Rieske (2Fe-2S) protein [Pseudonocardia dioxanivorans]|uniref:Rieske (2Fe-2S) protein n=1 Tax=Pseudonocardia dioxanivorans TaxID=240495 RepID=UPI000CD0DD54|nr:Rieske (2Fe-2S) protein [Pseudonocardia dioxanivorans]
MSRTAPSTTTDDAPPATAPGTATYSRRAIVAGAGAVAVSAGLLVAGCSTGSGGSDPGSGSGEGSGPAPTTGPLGPSSDVPVGSAKIYEDQGVVVTQASAGTFAAFSTTCPHQGCTVNEVQGTSIICPCHGSTFGLDGSVERGPAQRGLTPEQVKVEGGQIVLG